jgi:hypothetical protein
MIEQMRLQEIWENSNCIARFVKTADHNGFGLWSIRDFLRDKDIKITEEEIDELRM